MHLGKRMTMILAGFVGNVVEWYDFAVYGYMAGILSTLFFPSDDSMASLIATYGVFAAGFVMRPIGSGVFGWLGDTIGRSRTMFISVTMMVVPTFVLGCLPTYQQVGIAAPVLLVIIRLVQGLSVGGEFSSSVTYLVETADVKRRGLAGSWANTGSIFGMMLGAGVSALVTSLISVESVNDWGWRLPFLFGGIIGAISILMRRHLPKSEHFQRHHEQRGKTSPLLEAFTTNRREMALAVVFASAYGVLFYLPVVYLPEWLHSETGMARHRALQINTAATAILLVLIPLSGWLGDHLLRRTHLIATAMLLLAVSGWPLYKWLAEDGLVAAIVVQSILIALIAVPLGSAPAMFAELFPARDRLSGYSVAYNLGLGVVGGTTPMLSTWLIDTTGRSTAPAAYLVLMAGVACVALLLIHDRSREPLR
jgi:MHS family proline/betaine transporter-like MFS transporter